MHRSTSVYAHGLALFSSVVKRPLAYLPQTVLRHCIWIMLVSFGLNVGVQSQEDLITPHDVAMTRSVISAEISPNGEQVIYVVSVPRDPKSDESGGAWTDVHVVDRDGNSRPFITGKQNVSSVAWLPDGSAISFLATRDGDKSTSLYLISVYGGEARKLVELKTSITEYSWRPDGQRVALIAPEPRPESEKKLADKGFNAEIYEEQQQFSRVYLVDADPDTDDEPVQLELAGNASEVHFSPDGTELLLALAENPSIDYFYMYRRLFVVDAETGAVTAQIDNPGKLGPVRWSPNGEFIAFCSGEDINDPSEGRLMIVSAKGGTPAELMPDYLPNIIAIEWYDDDSILFTTEDGCFTGYGSIGRSGGSPQMYINPGGPIITNFSISDDREWACFTAASPKYPNEVFVFNHREVPVQLTQTNPWLKEKRLAAQEVIQYNASTDGELIEGVLVRPLDEQPGRRYPLIVAVHGGPEASVPNGWVTSYTNPGQLAAARGFAVFYPNYRGSTGRGVAFAKAHQSDYGGKEFDDIIDGIDYLIESGLVDKSKVGITGGSYGGFATAWCATKHSERFAAGVMFVGISNQISKSGTTDIPEEMYLVHARKRVWEDWQFYLERSPIYHVENCRTPLLILHGKNDTRVHPSQSMELYRHLTILGKAPVRLVFYPGEGHGNRKSAARYDFNLRLMRWMEHYLIGQGGDKPPFDLDYDLE